MAGYNLDEKTGLLGMFGAIKNPSKILKENDVVEVKHYNMFNVITATVEYVDDTTIKLVAKDNISETILFPQDPIVINSTGTGEVYVLGAEIISVDKLSPVTLTVAVSKIEKMKDLRKYERYYVSLGSNIKIAGISEPAFSIVKNISLGGIKVNCNEDILMEDIVDVTVILDKNSKLIFRGRIVRKNKIHSFFEYGIEILEITEGNRRNLHHFVNAFQF